MCNGCGGNSFPLWDTFWSCKIWVINVFIVFTFQRSAYNDDSFLTCRRLLRKRWMYKYFLRLLEQVETLHEMVKLFSYNLLLNRCDWCFVFTWLKVYKQSWRKINCPNYCLVINDLSCTYVRIYRVTDAKSLVWSILDWNDWLVGRCDKSNNI